MSIEARNESNEVIRSFSNFFRAKKIEQTLGYC